MSNIDLWELKTGRKKAKDISDKRVIRYGHDAESPIRELFALDYADRYEVSYGGAYDMVFHSTHSWMFATLDGRLKELKTGRNGVLEIKTAGIQRATQREKWWGDEGPRIPDQYFAQILHQLNVTGWDFAVLCAKLNYQYGPAVRSEIRSYFIERNEVVDDLEYLEDAEVEFWEKNVKQDIKPPYLLRDL